MEPGTGGQGSAGRGGTALGSDVGKPTGACLCAEASGPRGCCPCPPPPQANFSAWSWSRQRASEKKESVDLPIDGRHQTAPPEASSPIATANTLPPTAAQCRRRHLPLVRSQHLTTVLVRRRSAREQPPPLRHHQNRDPPLLRPSIYLPQPSTANHDNEKNPPILPSTWISSPLPRERRLPQWRTHTSTTMITSTLLPAPDPPPPPFRWRADGTERAWPRPDGGAR